MLRGIRLLVLDHHVDPLLEILLHFDSAPLQELLDPFDLGLQHLELIVFMLILLFVSRYLHLKFVFLLSALNLSVFVHQTSQRILLSDLLNLVGKILYSLPVGVDAGT